MNGYLQNLIFYWICIIVRCVLSTCCTRQPSVVVWAIRCTVRPRGLAVLVQNPCNTMHQLPSHQTDAQSLLLAKPRCVGYIFFYFINVLFMLFDISFIFNRTCLEIDQVYENTMCEVFGLFRYVENTICDFIYRIRQCSSLKHWGYLLVVLRLVLKSLSTMEENIGNNIFAPPVIVLNYIFNMYILTTFYGITVIVMFKYQEGDCWWSDTHSHCFAGRGFWHSTISSLCHCR